MRQHPADPNTRFYFVCGITEGSNMVPLMQAVHDALLQGGVPTTNLKFNVRADGQHAEWFWRREFLDAYRQLSVSVRSKDKESPLPFSAYLNSDGTKLVMHWRYEQVEPMLEIEDSKGNTRLRQQVQADTPVNVRQLPKGSYVLRLTTEHQQGTQLLVKQ